MSTLIYTELVIRPDDVERHLESIDRFSKVHVMVPVRPLTTGEQQFFAVEFDGDAGDREARFAEWRLGQVTDALRSAGYLDVDGQTSVGSPVDAIERAVEDRNFDEVVVVTEPSGVAGWIHLDLPHRIERHVDEPVVHVEIDEPA